MFSRIRSVLQRFRTDRSGTIALMMGLLAIPLILAVGVFLDYARALVARERLANAIDAAALAVGASAEKNLTEAEVKALAQSYFDANYPPAERGWMAPLNVQFDGKKVTISANGKVDTTLMRIAGIDQVDIAANTEVVRLENHVELVLALDNTGSMAGSKLAALKTASEGLVNILFGDEDESDYVKVGLVPFAAAVNVGVDKTNSGWIDLSAQSSIHAEDFSPRVNLFDMFGGLSRVWNGCVRARPAPYDLNDALPVAATPNTLFVPFLAPDEPGNAGAPESGYNNSYLNDAYAGGGTKEKDKEKDKTKDKNGGGTAICDGAASAALRQQCPYKYVVSPTVVGPDKNCPPQPILALTDDKSDIISEIQAMVASGSTVIPEGLAWGWRVISPTSPYTEGVGYDDDSTVKAIVLLTDGENSVGGGGNGHNKSIYSAFGYAAKGHLGNINGSDAEDNLDAKTATLCANIKEVGIRIYTITLQVSDIPTQNLMRNCASETSMYYNTTTGSDLGNVFADIATGLNELRISK